MNTQSKSWRRIGVVALGLFIANTMTATALSRGSYSRPATAADIAGLWKVVHWSTAVDRDELNSYAAPHQWYLFDNDGTLRFMTSSSPNRDSAQVRATLESLPATIQWSCPSEGKVETSRTDIPAGDESWLAFYVTRDTADPEGKVDLQSGDVVMTLLDQAGNPLYTRQMRRLVAPAPPQLGPR